MHEKLLGFICKLRFKKRKKKIINPSIRPTAKIFFPRKAKCAEEYMGPYSHTTKGQNNYVSKSSNSLRIVLRQSFSRKNTNITQINKNQWLFTMI